MTITTFDKLSPQDQSLVRLAMQYRDNAYTPYSHHQVGAIDTLVCYGPYSGVPCAECRQVIWEFCDNNPDVRIIGATTEGEIELMTIGEIYPYPYGPATKGIDCKEY